MLCHFENNQIFVDIEVKSLLAPELIKNTLTAKVDTGFSGDLQLTYDIAFPLGLTLKGFQPWTLADKSTVTFLECLGLVSFGGRVVASSIDVKPAGSILIGVSLLKKLGCEFKVNFIDNTAEINLIPIVTPATTPAPIITPPASSPNKEEKKKTPRKS